MASTAVSPPIPTAAPWVVYYYAAFSGRGHAIEALLAYAGEKYVIKGKDEMLKDSNGTCFAPAAVGRGGRIISQLAASMQFLGAELGYSPPASKAAEGLKCALDIADVWSEMYNKRKALKSWAEADEFIQTRLKRWFACLSNSIKVFGGEGPFFFGKKITYVDFSLYNLLRNFEVIYGPDRTKVVAGYAPAVFRIYKEIHTSKQLATFIKTERPILYPSVLHDGKMPFNA